MSANLHTLSNGVRVVVDADRGFETLALSVVAGRGARWEDEARSGWELVEKFDDARLRFKRPTAARNIPSPAGLDPYRTNYGISQGKLTAIILLAVFGSMGLIIAVVAVLTNHH